MRRSNSDLNVPLNQRREGGRAAGTPQGDAKTQPARACWVAHGPDLTLPGTVHAWQQDPASGKWRALVAVWLPAESVSPRDE